MLKKHIQVVINNLAQELFYCVFNQKSIIKILYIFLKSANTVCINSYIKIEREIRMIKGVNKQVLEVTNTENPYFERIVFFVKPEYQSGHAEKLKKEAQLYAARAKKPPGQEELQGNQVFHRSGAFMHGCRRGNNVFAWQIRLMLKSRAPVRAKYLNQKGRQRQNDCL